MAFSSGSGITIYGIKGRGTDFVGNSINSIEEGELLLFGKNLPHTRLGDTEESLDLKTDWLLNVGILRTHAHAYPARDWLSIEECFK